MNSKTVAIVAGGAVALAAVAALVVSRAQQATAVQEYGGLVFPGLSGKANDVAAIAINSGGKISTIEKKGTSWVLKEKGGYPVKIEKVKEIVIGLAQLKEMEPKTSKPDRYADIGVQDPPAEPVPEQTPDPESTDAPPPPKATPSKVTLTDASGAMLASAVVGQQRLGSPPSVFVRKVGEAQSWLAEGQIEVPTEASGWFDTEIINLSRDRVQRAMITQGKDGDPQLVVHRARKEDANFTVEGVPEGRSLKTPGAGDPLATALSYVNFDDVAPSSTITAPEGVLPVTYQAATFDGMVVTARVIVNGGKYWASFEASVDEAALPKAEATPAVEPPKAPADPAAPPAPDPAKAAAEEAAKKAEEVRKEVKTFNDRHGGWSYSIPEFKAKSLMTRLDELLAEAEPPKGPQGPAATLPGPVQSGPGATTPAPAPGQTPPTPAPTEPPPSEPPAEPK